VVVEASPWIEDNDWLLNLAEDHPIILGVVGNLPVGTPEFSGHLRRLARRRSFKGIRIGADTLSAALAPGPAAEDLQRVADADLAVDLLVPPDRLGDAARLAAGLPNLRLVVDHCANVPVGVPLPEAWKRGLGDCHTHPNLFMKWSGLVEGTGRRGGLAPRDPANYLPVTHEVWSAFGPDRLLFGSNWPVSLLFAPYDTVLGIAKGTVAAEAPGAAPTVFRDTAIRVYRLDPTAVTTEG
jgi:predicted TIM-barrel fold metal-dependent hydrolase